VKDEEPLLFTTGYKATFPALHDAVAQLIDPAELRWVGFSHFESDECGALNHWLEVAPNALPVCSFVGAAVNINDFAIRPPRGLQDGEILTPPANAASGSVQPPSFRMAGMQGCCSRRPIGHCSAPICSTTTEMSRH